MVILKTESIYMKYNKEHAKEVVVNLISGDYGYFVTEKDADINDLGEVINVLSHTDFFSIATLKLEELHDGDRPRNLAKQRFYEIVENAKRRKEFIEKRDAENE